jgi:[protein-PII] uridylyltransferase
MTRSSAAARTKTENRDAEIEFPPEMTGPELIETGRRLIEDARAQLTESTRSLAGGKSASTRFTRFHDALLRALYRHVMNVREREGLGAPGSLCLVALGGYGRRDLSLRSDIDIMFLIGDKRVEQEDCIKRFLHVLYDWKLDVGHSVRTVNDALAVIHADLESTTSMLESHWLAGSRPLYQHHQETFMRAVRGSGKRWFIHTKSKEWQNRRDKYDSTVYLLEPNLKEGAGGLRDIHSVRWLLQVLEASRDLSTLEDLKVLTSRELRALKKAEEFIGKIRNALHALSPRKTDVLTFQAQIAITQNWKYPAVRGHLAEEVLMREYYQHARVVEKLTTRAFSVLIRREKGSLGTMLGSLKRKRVDRFYFVQDDVIFADEKYFEQFKTEPSLILRLFAQARKLGLRVSERTRDRIEKLVPEIDPSFRTDVECKKFFWEIISGPTGTAQVLADMHDCGLLSAYFPEFESVHCMVRMDHYHRYTVDEHLLKSVEVCERLLKDPPARLSHAAEIARKIERLDLLYMALLFHDVGKGRGKGHALIGGQIIQRIGHRLRLPQADIDILHFLILSHLKISHVAQRRDLDDPRVAREMADAVESLPRLDLLYVHSVCDLGAVSPDAMTQWTATLYENCYHITAQALTGSPQVGTNRKLDMKSLAAGVLKSLESSAPDPEGHRLDLKSLGEDINAFLDSVPDRYLKTTRVESIAQHFLMLRTLDDKTRVQWELDAGPGLSELAVCSVDVPGSFAMICGALMAKGINIWSAQIYSTTDGFAINRFQVTDLNNKPLPAGFRLERLKADLNKVLSDRLTMAELLERYGAESPKRGPVISPRRSEIRFDNEGSQHYTIVEVRSADRPGLLYRIARVFDDCKLNIHRAMLTTEAYGVVDVFFVTDLEYNKIHDVPKMERLERELKKELDREFEESDSGKAPA